MITTIFRTDDGKEFDNAADAFQHDKKLNGVKKYRVTIYYAGSHYTVVEANNKKEALEKAQPYPEEIDFGEVSYDIVEINE